MTRIVSLVPAATEIVAALGRADQLVGVTHDCTYPQGVLQLPRVTRSTIPSGSTSGEIDAAVRRAAERGESTFHLDADVLRELRPDVLLGQTVCRVCAVTLEQVPLSMSAPPRVVPLDGETIQGVFADIRRVAETLDLAREGDRVIRELRTRLERVEERVTGHPRPRVACLEWVDPLFNGGHWVPEQIAIAGGRDILGRAGERSREVEWDEVRAAGPEVLVLALCGFDVARALADAPQLRDRPGWETLPAVRRGRVFAVDGSAHFSRPGPRLVEGVEVLGALFHPDLFPPADPVGAMAAPA
ncbi:MAG: cobalamin-binding protein [Candidatus Limnocylindria bacterium]